MIHYENIKRYDNIPFEDYLKFEGYSHSFLKRERNGIVEELTMTDNIMLGKIVDQILTDSEADMMNPLYTPAKKIAYEIQRSFGNLLPLFEKQVSFTADVRYEQFVMKTTGRLDYVLPKHAVVDLKVTKSKNIKQLIEFMGYENQLWHYSRAMKLKDAYILIYSVPLNKTFVVPIDVSKDTNAFWEDKIINFGRVAA